MPRSHRYPSLIFRVRHLSRPGFYRNVHRAPSAVDLLKSRQRYLREVVAGHSEYRASLCGYPHNREPVVLDLNLFSDGICRRKELVHQIPAQESHELRMVVFPLSYVAAGFDVIRFDIDYARRHARHVHVFDRLVRISNTRGPVSFHAYSFARGAVLADELGVIGADLGVPLQQFVELVQIGSDRELSNHKRVGPEVGDLLLPVAVQAVQNADDHDYRSDADDNSKQRQGGT